MSTRQRRTKVKPATPKADEVREVARRSLAWTKRGAILTGTGIAVTIAIAVLTIIITNRQARESQQPLGVAVTTVPVDS